jgi:hypothetical protein
MSKFRSSALRLMPPQNHERWDKWTHEPRSNLNHNKHVFDAFMHSFIFSIILLWKYKNNLLSCTHNQNPKTSLSHHIYFIALLFTLPYCTSYFIFTYIYNLCLTTTRWSWGHNNEEIVLQVARRRTMRAFVTVPREFDINPEFPRGKKLLLLQHSPL